MDFENVAFDKKDSMLRQLGKIYNGGMAAKQVPGFFVEEQARTYECIKVKVRVDEALKRISEEAAEYIRYNYLHKKNGDNLALNHSEAFKKSSIDAFLHCLYG